MGGECAVRAHKNSLIIRTSFGSSEYPYEFAYSDRFVSKDYVDVIAPMIKDLVLSDEVGVINVGTSNKTLYEYVKQRNPKVKELKQGLGQMFIMNITKLRKFYNKK